jgi:hypothetical protein
MDTLNFDNQSANILEQLASYNKEDINSLIDTLQTQLDEQKHLNTVLNKENAEEDLDILTNFLEQNKEVINEQEIQLENIVSELKSVVNDNREKLEEKTQLTELVENTETKEIAIKLRNIRSLKESIKSFLLKNGITTMSV